MITMGDLITTGGSDLSIEDIKKKKAENIDIALTNVFMLPANTKSIVKDLVNIRNTKIGIMAATPIKCFNSRCPFDTVCPVSSDDRMEGQLCPVEVAAIIDRFEGLCLELGVNDTDYVDIGLIKDVVDIEIKILRIDRVFAKDGNVLKEYLKAVDNQGDEHMDKEPDKLFAIHNSLLDKKMKLLEKLNSTRKDKIEDMKKKKDTSIKSANAMAKMRMIQASIKEQKLSNEQSIIDKEVDIIEIEGEDIEDIYDTIEEI